MKNAPWQLKSLKTILLAATPLFLMGVPAFGQSNGAPSQQDNPAVRDNDTGHGGLAAFDRFMDSHPDVAAQVRQKPWLLTSYDFLQSHPDLNQFLQAHPQLRTEISQNSTVFMQTANFLDQPDGRRDLQEFDRFLDSHADIAAQLHQKPWLVTNQQFLQSHPDLNSFLQQHPQLHSQIGQNPVAFMQEENLFDQQATQGQDRDADRDADARNGRPDRGQGDRDADNRGNLRNDVATFDRFLDSHPEISEQLRKNPALVADRQFVTSHPALGTFLQQNPGVRDAIQDNPRAFMQAEQRFDQREDARNGDRDFDNGRNTNGQGHNVNNNPGDNDRDRDANASNRDFDRDRFKSDSDRFRQFCDSHPEIGEQIRRNPALVEDRQFVENHQALKAYVQDHPEVRDEIRSDQNGFMQRDQNRQFAANNGYDNDRDRDNGVNRDHAADFGKFLNNHANIARDCSTNPAVLKDQQYVESHPELKAYLDANPQIADELKQNPDTFIKEAQQLNYSGSGSSGTGVTGGSSTTGTSGSSHSTGGTGTGMAGGSGTSDSNSTGSSSGQTKPTK